MISSAASLLLAAVHLGAIGLPGCRGGSACGKLAASAWGAIPLGLITWPTAYVGAAWFIAMLVFWIASRGTLPSSLRQLVRLGGLASLAFVIIMIVKGSICGYCTAAHLANFAFVALVELRPAQLGSSRAALFRVAGGFLFVSLIFLAVDLSLRAQFAQKAESELAASTREMIARGEAQRSATAPPATAEQQATPADVVTPNAASDADAAASDAGAAASDADAAASGFERATSSDDESPAAVSNVAQRIAPSGADQQLGSLSGADQQLISAEPAHPARPFTGRYRIGPEIAPIRIVIFTDYQCQDCFKIEKQLKTIVESQPDVSVSIKHFPFNPDCNAYAKKAVHSNACYAARAAEAAGRLWGPAGFWKMHEWLFERRGTFTTTEELEDGIRGMGYDPAGFTQLMMAPEVLAAIREDTEEAESLGLFFTPMIFINGVELRGWSAPDALVRAVTELSASHPAAASADHDRPALAREKYFTDWKEQPKLELPADSCAWRMGSSNPKIDVVMWGDYQEANTALADSIIRRFVAGRADARYAYRNFPVNSDCNPKAPDRRHPYACRAALAAEVAGQIGGPEMYWKMHDWLMRNRTSFSEESLRSQLVHLGLDAAAVAALMEKPESGANIAEDIAAGGKLPVLRYGVPPGIYAVPAIFANGRYVPRWQLDDQTLLEEILSAAGE